MADDIHFDDPRVGDALREWHRSLESHRRERALLRRCRSLKDLQTPDDRGRSKLSHFFNALHSMGFHRSHDNQQLAYVAGTLAHIKVDSPDALFAAQLATSEDGTPRLSERRFQKLLQLEDRDRLHRLLIRVLRMMNGQANMFDLAKGVYYWNDRIHQDWARDYYARLLAGDTISLIIMQKHLPHWARDHEAVIALDEAVTLDLNNTNLKPYQRLQFAALAWWETLDNHPGERVNLRRCHRIEDVLLERGFHRFRRYACHAGLIGHDKQLASVAGLLAHIKKGAKNPKVNEPNPSFARQLATPKEKQSRARFSGLRFRRLLQREDRDGLYRPLIRAIYHLECEANVEDLATSVYFWSRERRKNWDTDYWAYAPKDEK